MHLARLLPSLALGGFLVLAAAACSAGSAPGWTYAPTPSPSPVASPSAGASGAPSAGPSGSAAPAPSGSPAGSGGAGGTALDEVASGVQFTTTSLEAPANAPFQIKFDNQDASIPHNIEIADSSGKLVFEGDTVNGPAQITYNVPALAAGTYKFSCKWHPNMVGQLTTK